MGQYMVRFLVDDPDAVLLPNALQRVRLWNCGYNRSTLLADTMSRRRGNPRTAAAMTRPGGTCPPKGMNLLQRTNELRGAFFITRPCDIVMKRVILVVDVLPLDARPRLAGNPFSKGVQAKVE
jgi:predicted amidophosphoribosyltransferase